MKEIFVRFTPYVLALVISGITGKTAIAAPYTEIGFGGALPFNHELKNSLSPDAELSYKDTFAITGEIGYSFNNGFRIGAEYSYHAPEFDKLKGHIAGIPVEFTGYKGSDLTVNTFMANGYYDLKTKTPITPFIGVGLGVGYLSADSAEPEDPGIYVLSDDEDVVFAYQATAGVSFDINEHFAITGSYRYLGTTEGTFETTLTDGTNSLTGDTKASYSANIIRAGIRYTF